MGGESGRHMIHSTIGETEASSMVRLIADVAALHADHTTAKRHLMDGLARLIGADCWLWALTHLSPRCSNSHLFMLHGGFSEERFSRLVEAADHPELSVLMEPFTAELTRTRSQLTRLRQEIDPGDKFSATRVHALFLAAGVRPLMLSARPLDDKSQSFVAIYRHAERPDFTQKDKQIAHILLGQVNWLHLHDWPAKAGAKVPVLSPRCRTVLNLLLDGQSRKAIARELGISINTVAGYAKEIYAAFHVQSHAELLLAFRGHEAREGRS